MSIYGHEFDKFWYMFGQAYPDIKLSEVWYEICLDFWEDEYDECLTVKENLAHAASYIKSHINDYD